MVMVKFLLRLPLQIREAINVRAKEMGLSANAFPSPYGDFSF